ARAERRRGNAEDDVLVAELRVEVGLRQHASGRVGASGDGVEPVDAAVEGAVGVAHEARLAHRTVGGDERRYGLYAAGDPIERGQRHLWIGRAYLSQRRMRARPADVGLRVTAGTAVGVERGAEAAALFDLARDRVDLAEDFARGGEERLFGLVQSRDGT